LKRRTLPNPAAPAISVIVRAVSVISVLARKSLRVWAIDTGDAPRCRRRSRRRWRSPIPSRAASRSTPSSSSAPSAISRSARAALLDVPRQAGRPGAASGRQRRQGRKPASWAAAALGRKRQCSRRGVRAGQIGRQKIPVVRTAVKKRPSKRASRVWSAR
jgi:hypothetical protein